MLISTREYLQLIKKVALIAFLLNLLSPDLALSMLPFYTYLVLDMVEYVFFHKEVNRESRNTARWLLGKHPL